MKKFPILVCLVIFAFAISWKTKQVQAGDLRFGFGVQSQFGSFDDDDFSRQLQFQQRRQFLLQQRLIQQRRFQLQNQFIHQRRFRSFNRFDNFNGCNDPLFFRNRFQLRLGF